MSKANWIAASLALTSPAAAADLPNLPPAEPSPYSIALPADNADFWKGLTFGSGVSASFAKGAKSAFGADTFVGYDHRFDNGYVLGLKFDTGYLPFASQFGQPKGFDYAATELKLGYQIGRLTPFVEAGVALGKTASLNGVPDAGETFNGAFAAPGQFQAMGIAGVGVDYAVTDKLHLGVGAYMSNGAVPFGH